MALTIVKNNVDHDIAKIKDESDCDIIFDKMAARAPVFLWWFWTIYRDLKICKSQTFTKNSQNIRF